MTRTALVSTFLTACLAGVTGCADDESASEPSGDITPVDRSVGALSSGVHGDPTTPTPSTADSSATYGGGPVLSNVRIVSVFWGPNVDTTVTSQIGGFYSTLVDSPYLDWMREY